MVGEYAIADSLCKGPNDITEDRDSAHLHFATSSFTLIKRSKSVFLWRILV